MNTNQSTVVLLDPSDADGEAGVRLLDPHDRFVAVVIPVGGYLAQSLREFCRAEDVGLAAAADLYFDQVTARIKDDDLDNEARGADQRSLTMHGIDGIDYVGELVELTRHLRGSRIVVPTSATRSRGFSPGRLAESSGVPLTVAPSAAATPPVRQRRFRSQTVRPMH